MAEGIKAVNFRCHGSEVKFRIIRLKNLEAVWFSFLEFFIVDFFVMRSSF